MGLKTLSFSMTGIAPLLMHSGALADPLNPQVKQIKQITAKGSKKRTDVDDMRMAQLEWAAGLYLDEDKRVVLPSDSLEAMIVEAARSTRKGKDAQRAVYVEHAAVLDFQGKPSGAFDVDKLIDDGTWLQFTLRVGAKIAAARVMRTRPRFHNWSTKFTMAYDESVFNKQAIVEIIDYAGKMIGVGDWRPKYGRFESQLLS